MDFRRFLGTGLAGVYLIAMGVLALPHTMWFHGHKILSTMTYQSLVEKEGVLRAHFGRSVMRPESENIEADRLLGDFENLIISVKVNFVNKPDPWAIAASVLGLSTSVFFIVAGVQSVIFTYRASPVIYCAVGSYALLLSSIIVFLSSLLRVVRDAGRLIIALTTELAPGTDVMPLGLARMLLQPSFIMMAAVSVVFYILIPLGLVRLLNRKIRVPDGPGTAYAGVNPRDP